MSHPLLRAATVSSDILRDLASRDATMDLFSPSTAEEATDCGRLGATEMDAAIVESAVRPPIVVCIDESPATGISCAEPQRLVWGFRYRGLWNVRPDLACPVIVCSAASEVELLTLALAAENRGGAFRWSEIDRVVAACEEAVDGATGAPWEAILGHLDGDKDIRPALERYRRLPRRAAAAFDRGAIDLRTAEAIPRELDDAFGLLAPTLDHLSFSNRRLAVRFAIELMRRDGLDVTVLAAALHERTPAEALTWLRHRRYPRLTAMEDHLSEVRRRRLAGTGIELEPPSNFEGDAYRVSFRLSSREELERRLAAVATLTEELDGLLDLLF